jgi:DTW domain-containing protein YfiP
MSSAVREYFRRKAELISAPARMRCLKCKKPHITCYCADLRPISSSPRIVILMHPLEFKHPIGTGRLAHHCLKNSELWVGADFKKSDRLAALLADETISPQLLFPGEGSQNLSAMNLTERKLSQSSDKKNVLFVLDGTWHLAKKMLHRTPQLQNIPRISFVPKTLSRFVVRKQPRPDCYSTLEAISEVLELLDSPAPHLLEMFSKMLNTQLSFNNQRRPSRHAIAYAKRKAKRLNERVESDPIHSYPTKT